MCQITIPIFSLQLNLGFKFEDTDQAHFIEDETKVKMSFEINFNFLFFLQETVIAFSVSQVYCPF